MIDPPLSQDIVDQARREGRQQAILDLLEDRFGPEAKGLEAHLKVLSMDRFWELVMFAGRCRSLASFRKRLLAVIPEEKAVTESTKARRPGSGPRREDALEARREDIIAILSMKFHWEIDDYKAELTAGLKRIDDDDRLRHLLERAVRCVSLYDFHQSLLPTSKLAARIAPEVRREIIADWARQYYAINLDLLEVMLEQEKQDKALKMRRESIVKGLESRFGFGAWAVARDLDDLPGNDIDELSDLAVACPHLASFHQETFTRLWTKRRTYLGGGAEAREESREAVLKMLGIRFGIKATRLERDLDAIDDDDRLRDLFERAAQCASLGEFRERLSP